MTTMCNDNDNVYRVKHEMSSCTTQAINYYNTLFFFLSLYSLVARTAFRILSTSSAYALGAATRNTHHHAPTPATHTPVATTPNAPVAWNTCVGAAMTHVPVVMMLQG